MKKLLFILPALFLVFFSCKKDEPVTPSGPQGLDLSVTDMGNNSYFFENKTSGVTVKWDFGNGQTAEGDTATVTYVFAGTYVAKGSALISGSPVEDTIVIDVTDTRQDLLESILNDTIYQRLTGGLDNVDGKVWVWDSITPGHFGVGDPAMFTPNWWSAPALDKTGKSMYDDKLIFNIYNFKFSLENNGYTYAKDYAATDLSDTTGYQEENGTDYVVPYTPPESVPFTITRDNEGNAFIEFTGMGFPSMYTGKPLKYQIMSITDDVMVLRHHYADANNDFAWYFRFIREGYQPEQPQEKPYKIDDIFDDFEGNGNITWYTDEVTGFETVANPASDATDNSANVAMYTRGTDNMYENVQVRLDYKMDITQRNVFKIKAYFPSSNDYSGDLAKTVSVKLQNGEAGEPWVTQAEIKDTVDVLDQWVELTFDYSAFDDGTTIARKDFDRIILQLGGEGHNVPGVFYVDDFELQP